MRKRAKRKSTEERQLEIAGATLAFVANHGVARLTTAAIAKEIGVAEGTIFRHFDTKEDIILAAIARLEEVLLTVLPAPGGPPLDRLGEFFTSRVPLVAKNPGMARLIYTSELGREAGEDGMRAVARLQARSLGFVKQCLEDAQKSGALREGLEPAKLVTVVQGAALALVNFGDWMGEGQGLRERAEGVWETLRGMMES